MKLFWSSWVGQRLLFKKLRTGSLQEVVQLVNRHNLLLIPTKEREVFILGCITIIFSALVKRSWATEYLSQVNRKDSVGFKKNSVEKSFSYNEALLISKALYPQAWSAEQTIKNCLDENLKARKQQLSDVEKKNEGEFLPLFEEMIEVYRNKKYSKDSTPSIMAFVSQNLSKRTVLDEELLALAEFGLLDLVDLELLPENQWEVLGQALADRWFKSLSLSHCYGDVLSRCWESLKPATQEKFKKEGYKVLHGELSSRFDLTTRDSSAQMEKNGIHFFKFLMATQNTPQIAQELKENVKKEVSFIALCTRQYDQIQGVGLNEALDLCCAPLFQDEAQFKEDETKWAMVFDRLQLSLGHEAKAMHEKISQSLLENSDMKGQPGFDFLFSRHLMFNVRKKLEPAVPNPPIKIDRF